MTFDERDIPSLRGRIVLVTGGNSGIGLEAARMFAEHGAHVVVAARSEEKGRVAVDAIRAGAEDGAKVELMRLDLASLRSVRAFANVARERLPKLDVLVNNAGVMALPYCTTEDGFEMQLGTNHLGHFALTGLLLPLLEKAGTAASPARVVNVSSLTHVRGAMRFHDLMGERRYDRFRAYAQSKLANLLFSFDLSRRLEAAGKPIRSACCHPGYASTNLLEAPVAGTPLGVFTALGNSLFAQSARAGAWPTVYAATSADVAPNDYIGPSGPMQMWGPPARVRPSSAARDPEAACKLWERSVLLTGVDFGGL